MPAPASVNELLDRLRKSGLVPTDRLNALLAQEPLPGGHLTTVPGTLDRLVSAGLITPFHANKLAAGKYKGFHLGSYLILDQLGPGGTGHVYLAEHGHMRRLVALKVFPVYAVGDAVARERFFRGARAAGALDHPNIARVFDLCQEGQILYLVMEYVEGLSLQSLVAQAGPPSVAAACHYVRQVAVGLQHAHELGFVHRDIKPANLLLDRTGVVKILDLGLVRSEADKASMLTRQMDNKSVLGTADYVAPEQAVDSSEVDARADLYSLGATLYFLLAGRPLFPEGSPAQKLVWQQVKDPVPVTRLRSEVPAALAAVVHKMLQKHPVNRFPTASAVFEALAPFDRDEIPPPDPMWIPEPPLRASRMRSGPPAAAARSASEIGTSAHVALGTCPGPDSATIAVSASDSTAHPAVPRNHESTATASSEDTRAGPRSDRRPEPTTARLRLTVLFVSIALALLGIVIWLFSK